MTAISIAIAATTNPITMSRLLSRVPGHEPVYDHHVSVLVDAERERVRRHARPAYQKGPAGDALRGVVAETCRKLEEGAGRLFAAGQAPPQGGVDGYRVTGNLAGQAQRRDHP